jgi:hypothetical protein
MRGTTVEDVLEVLLDRVAIPAREQA